MKVTLVLYWILIFIPIIYKLCRYTYDKVMKAKGNDQLPH